MKLSLIVPVLNEAESIPSLLSQLAPLRHAGHEIILADGGSSDGTVRVAQPYIDTLTRSDQGRAAQMNAGAARATGDMLWFVHADTRFPITVGLQRHVVEILSHPARWGRFRVRLDHPGPIFRLIERMMNWRSCVTGIATGDQGIFVDRTLFERVGGYPRQPLMEDIELSRRLRRESRPVCLKSVLLTSARRWQRYGVARTILLMWRLRLAYFFGVPAERLQRHYPVCNSTTAES